jgi:hypothetical protein
MALTTKSLRTLHRIHIQREDLNDRLSQGPRQIGHSQTAVNLAKQQLAAAKDDLQKARLAADEKQMQLRQREMRIEDLTAKLNACSSNREFQTLKEQIAADRQANAVLEDEIFEALERIDGLQAAVATRQAELDANEQEFARVSDNVATQKQGLDAELARVEAELAAAEAELPEDMIIEYRRVSNARGADALAEVNGQFCGGCSERFTIQTLNELLLGTLMFCKRCGCLMYMPE